MKHNTIINKKQNFHSRIFCEDIEINVFKILCILFLSNKAANLFGLVLFKQFFWKETKEKVGKCYSWSERFEIVKHKTSWCLVFHFKSFRGITFKSSFEAIWSLFSYFTCLISVLLLFWHFVLFSLFCLLHLGFLFSFLSYPFLRWKDMFLFWETVRDLVRDIEGLLIEILTWILERAD